MRATLTDEEKKQRQRGYSQANWLRLKSDPERYEASKKKKAAYQRARRATPEGREAERAKWLRLKSDPERYEASKKKAAAYQRAIRSTPEGREADNLRNRRWREANRERVLQKQREYNARRWSDPAWRAQENAKRRQQLKEIKENDAAKLAQVRAAHAARQRRSRAKASPERLKAKNEYIKAWKRANPHYQQRETARHRAKREAQRLALNQPKTAATES